MEVQASQIKQVETKATETKKMENKKNRSTDQRVRKTSWHIKSRE
jgi:hypothetical protein